MFLVLISVRGWSISRYWPDIIREEIRKKPVIAQINNFKYE
jgi:hypothetical protein